MSSLPPFLSSQSRAATPPARRHLLAAGAIAVLLAGCSTPAPAPAPASTRRPPSSPPASAPPRPSPAPAPVNARFMWPATGPVLARFDGNRNKGIDIGGAMGDAVVASDAGRVVLVSSKLRGYGQLVIVKHDDTFLTAYAHTSRVLVKEGESVHKGQQIAEMGSTGTDRVKLHFEIRRQGVAVNPQPYLEGRLR